jgi:hypothetical protein
MGNINAPPLDFYESFASEIMGKFRRIAKLTPHGPSSGQYHEEILRNVLKNFLSKRFSVKTGFIYGKGKVSGQIDILIIDENCPIAYLFQEGDFVVVLPEAVVAVIEIKSTINSQNFAEGMDGIFRAIGMAEYHSITGIFFGFDGGTIDDQTLDRWFKNDKCKKYIDKKENAPDAIMFLSKGIMLLPYNEEPGISPKPGTYRKMIANQNNDRGKGSQLSVLLALIINSCIKKEMKVTHTFPTVQANTLIQDDEINLTDVSFAIGDGLIRK